MTGANVVSSIYIIPTLRKILSDPTPAQPFGRFWKHFYIVANGIWGPYFGFSVLSILLAPISLLPIVIAGFCFGMLAQAHIKPHWIMPVHLIIKKIGADTETAPLTPSSVGDVLEEFDESERMEKASL